MIGCMGCATARLSPQPGRSKVKGKGHCSTLRDNPGRQPGLSMYAVAGDMACMP